MKKRISGRSTAKENCFFHYVEYKPGRRTSYFRECNLGHRKRFADGKVSVAYSRFLGYDKGPDGKMVVNPEQAEIVKLIYRLFLEGMTPHTIAIHLTEKGIKTPGGKDKWNATTIRRILTK